VGFAENFDGERVTVRLVSGNTRVRLKPDNLEDKRLVRVTGIKARPELNGMIGFAEGFDGERVIVRMPDLSQVRLKPDNIVDVDEPAATKPTSQPAPSAEQKPLQQQQATDNDSAGGAAVPPPSGGEASRPEQPVVPAPNEDGYYYGVNVTQEKKEAGKSKILGKLDPSVPRENLREKLGTKIKGVRMQNQLGTNTMFIKP